jgi:hypothetical protein
MHGSLGPGRHRVTHSRDEPLNTTYHAISPGVRSDVESDSEHGDTLFRYTSLNPTASRHGHYFRYTGA